MPGTDFLLSVICGELATIAFFLGILVNRR